MPTGSLDEEQLAQQARATGPCAPPTWPAVAALRLSLCPSAIAAWLCSSHVYRLPGSQSQTLTGGHHTMS